MRAPLPFVCRHKTIYRTRSTRKIRKFLLPGSNDSQIALKLSLVKVQRNFLSSSVLMGETSNNAGDRSGQRSKVEGYSQGTKELFPK